jgi:hypothetical protein
LQKDMAMTTLATVPQPELLVDHFVPDEQVRRQVWGLLAGLYPTGSLPERRIDQRFPYPYLIYLTPVQNGKPLADSVVVAGKHLSERGLGFYHQRPLPYRHMIASLQGHDARWLGFLIDITWCRFTQHGWYDSGGRFLQSVPSPVPNLRARQAQ